MKPLKTTVLPIFLATLWISGSEFFRNELVFKSFWTEHYRTLGLVFPDAPVNGAMWGLWSLLFAVLIFTISRKHSLLPTILIAWLAGFLLMWVALGNLGVLPVGLLLAAVPLSLLETGLAAWMIRKLARDAG